MNTQRKIFISVLIIFVAATALLLFSKNKNTEKEQSASLSPLSMEGNQIHVGDDTKVQEGNLQEEPNKKQSVSEKEKKFSMPPEIVGPTGFINVDQNIKMADLLGKKVVLVKFWTFGCSNCQHTLPHVNDWYEKYKSQGLEIISFHTPEFSYEHKLENVEAAVKKWKIKFPVILDNDYKNFRAYNNRYWPRMYLVDKDGFIIFDHIGQGNYDEIEAEIQKLLSE